MAKRNYNSQQVGLSDADRLALAKLAEQHRKSNSEMARDAIRWYLEHNENLTESDREQRLAKTMFKCTDRICGLIVKCTDRICALLVRNVIDTNMVFMLLYRLLPTKEADDIAKKMYRMAVARVMRKIGPQELNIEKMIKEGLDQPTELTVVPAATNQTSLPATQPNNSVQPTGRATVASLNSH